MHRMIITLCSWLLSLIVGMPILIGGGLMGFDVNGYAPKRSDTLVISTQIHEQVAVTTIKQVFTNSTMLPALATYGFAVPANAMVTKFRWKARNTWYSTDTRSSGTGRRSGERATNLDTFSWSFGATPFIFMFKDSIKASEAITVELTYVELLPFDGGLVEYVYPLKRVASTTAMTINRWQIDIRSANAVSAFETTPSMIQVIEQTSQRVVLRGTSIRTSDPSISVRFKPRYDNLTMNVLSTKPDQEDGYALMLAVPRTDTNDEDVLPKRFTFVIDRSGSMAGNRLGHARAAARYCVEHLSAVDVFNVIRFDNVVEPLHNAHVPATTTNINDALEHINSIQPRGGTDIMAALRTALSMHKADGYVNVIIFLTDGTARIDHDVLKAANNSNTRIYVFGVGHTVNVDDLSRIGKDHNGKAVFVPESSSSVDAVSELFDFIKDPIIKNPNVSFSPDVVYDVYPQVIPDVYLGQQLVLVGRYRKSGLNTVTVTGNDSRGPVRSTFLADLTNDPNINTFVAKIWAQYRIALLLDLMRPAAQGSATWMEWRDEIIRLGQTYGIVTPFTSKVDIPLPDEDSETESITHDEIIVAGERCKVSPNPIMQSTSISVDLSDLDRLNVRVEIIDLQGKIINVLYDALHAPESLALSWDSKDQSGVPVAAGAYQLVITIDGRRSTTMLHVLR